MPNPLIQRAQLLFSQHRFDLAADACREALAQSPQDAYSHALLALCLVHQEKYDDATAEAQSAIHLAPDDPFSHYALGIIFQNRNRFPEAEASARQALQLAPEDADYWALLAQALFARERWSDALDAANSGLQFDPEHVLCTNLRAMALVKLGDKFSAAQSIAQALQRNPHSSLSHANQGWTMLHQNNHRQALEHFREALRLNPNDPWARDGMIAALKAQHFLYRLMLRYYLWMSRIGTRAQWGVIIGLWVIIQLLSAVKAGHPNLAPFIYPLLVAYALFVFASWLADPIFNLTLLLSPFGRYLLTTPARIGALIVGILLLGALVCTPLGFFADIEPLFLAGLLMLVLTLPAAATFRAREPNRLRLMGLYSLALAAAGIAGIALLSLDNDLASDFLMITLWGSVLSSFVSNILGSMIVKK
jgi:tetratricopeptide (TPR) repeat protein